MARRWRRGAWVVVSALCLASGSARAQTADAQQLGSAQALFERAKELMDAKKYDEACPKFEEVVKLVPTGVGAKIELARCYEEGGRLASAWASYILAENAASTQGQQERAKGARDKVNALKPRLSTLTITVPDALAKVPGLEVKRDGVVVTQPQWGLAIPVDAGKHVVVVSAPKKKRWEGKVDVPSGAASASLGVPAALEDESAAPAVGVVTPPVAAPAENKGDPSDKPASAPQQGGKQIPVWAWIAGGTGLALAGASVGFLVDERAAQAAIDDACPGGKTCSKGFDAKGANARLYRDFYLFVGLGIAGIAGIGTGIVGIATAPSKPAQPKSGWVLPAPWIAPGGGGLVLQGAL